MNYKKILYFNLSTLVIGFLIGVLLYYFLEIDLGKMTLSENLNIQDIFIHNSIYFLIAILGFITLGVVNVIMLILNAAIIGFFIAHGFKSNQVIEIVLALAPHSIFEISALLIASTFSLGYMSYIYKKLIKKRKIETKIYKHFIIVILLVLILTFIASLAEKYVNLV
ncbi:stage II sporulation protein M [Staphylococcus xylosus]|uniref:stage II sporulation protein M n=1 Tax=Staphylococcus TaxID=1279 RepID=UPI001E4E5C03|nr:stage II sporulation protein M [Staphylococcus xylosus]MEB8151649.1 stage II sporulation protein M [Staphylococcus xylosus]